MSLRLLEKILKPKETAKEYMNLLHDSARKQISTLMGPLSPPSLNPVKAMKHWMYEGLKAIGLVKGEHIKTLSPSQQAVPQTDLGQAHKPDENRNSEDPKEENFEVQEVPMTPEELQQAQQLEKETFSLVQQYRKEAAKSGVISASVPDVEGQDNELSSMADDRSILVGSEPTKDLRESHSQTFQDSNQVVECLARIDTPDGEAPNAKTILEEWKKSPLHHKAVLSDSNRYAIKARKGLKPDGSGTCWYVVLLLKKDQGAPTLAEIMKDPNDAQDTEDNEEVVKSAEQEPSEQRLSRQAQSDGSSQDNLNKAA